MVITLAFDFREPYHVRVHANAHTNVSWWPDALLLFVTVIEKFREKLPDPRLLPLTDVIQVNPFFTASFAHFWSSAQS